MATQKQVNMAENQLIVGSIKVIGDISGGGIETIKQEQQAISQSVTNLSNRQTDYWSEIASDEIVSPVEKKTLKKEFAQIETTHTAIMKAATEKSLSDLQIFKNYNNAYLALYNYLFSTLKLFSDMTTETKLPSYSVFISKYEDYFALEAEAQAAMTGTASATVRTLLSLEEVGAQGELAYYSGVLYRYNNGDWKIVTANNYKGSYQFSAPTAAVSDYFLATGNFAQGGFILKVQGKILKVNNKPLGVNFNFTKGYIYVYTEDGWRRVDDRKDFRYLIATGDLVAINGTVNEGLSSYVNTATEELINDKFNSFEADGVYLGILTEDPDNAKWGDYYLFNGVQTGLRIKGTIYKKDYKTQSWIALSSTESENYVYYMAALTSASQVYTGAIGFFSTILVNTIVAQDAIIKRVQTAVIELQEGGAIKSANFESNSNTETYKGFNLDYNGFFECSNGIFRGAIQSGPLSIDMASRNPLSYSWNTSNTWRQIINTLNSNSIYWSTYNVNGSYNNKTLLQISISKSSSTESSISNYHYMVDGTYDADYRYRKYTYNYTFKIKYSDITYQTISGTVTDETYTKENDNYRERGRAPIIEGYYDDPPFFERYLSDNFQGSMTVTFTGDEKVLKLINIPTSTEGYEKGTLWSDNGILKIAGY